MTQLFPPTPPSFVGPPYGTPGGANMTGSGVMYPGGYGGGSAQPGNSQFWDDIARRMQQEADRNYRFQRDQLRQQWNIARMNARTQEERNRIDREYNQAQIRLAEQRLALDTEIQRGQLQLQQGRLGLDLVSQAAQMRGAKNYVQAANMAHGVANNPYTPVAFNALLSGATMPGYGAQGGIPQAYTLGSQLADFGVNVPGAPGAPGGGGQPQSAFGAAMSDRVNESAAGQGPGAAPPGTNFMAAFGGGPPSAQSSLFWGAPAPNVRPLVNQAHAIYGQGAHKLGNGSLESLSPTELGLLQSAIEAPDDRGNAGDWDSFMWQYGNSRVGQRIGNNRAA